MFFWRGLSFQNIMNTNFFLEKLHDMILMWLLVITFIVIMLGSYVFMNKKSIFLSYSSLKLEILWTLLPVFILISIAFPSIKILMNQDTFMSPPFYSIKLIANQWNWQSQLLDFEQDHLTDQVKLDQQANFETPLILSFSQLNRILLTSNDVLHCLGMPSMGMKLDAMPGRLNALIFNVNSPGLLTGSCYELCGSGHSAMPIYMLSTFE